jgi:hypothetical protein
MESTSGQDQRVAAVEGLWEGLCEVPRHGAITWGVERQSSQFPSFCPRPAPYSSGLWEGHWE